MTFQPMSGPGWRVSKKSATVEQVRAKIQSRIHQLAGAANQAPVPPVVPADRGFWSANWRVEDWSGVLAAHRAAIEAVVVAVMREWEVEK